MGAGSAPRNRRDRRPWKGHPVGDAAAAGLEGAEGHRARVRIRDGGVPDRGQAGGRSDGVAPEGADRRTAERLHDGGPGVGLLRRRARAGGGRRNEAGDDPQPRREVLLGLQGRVPRELGAQRHRPEEGRRREDALRDDGRNRPGLVHVGRRVPDGLLGSGPRDTLPVHERQAVSPQGGQAPLRPTRARGSARRPERTRGTRTPRSAPPTRRTR